MIRINGGEATLGANTFTGAQVAPSLALGGATIGSNALAVTGTAAVSTSVSSPIFYNAAAGGILFGAQSTTNFFGLNNWAANGTLQGRAGSVIGWGASTTNPDAAAPDTALSRISAGIIGVGTGAAGSIAGGLQAATLAIGGATIGSNALAVTGTVNFSGLLTLQAGASANAYEILSAGTLYWAARSQIKSPSNGVITLFNTANDDFTRLQFGGITSSFPAITKESANIIGFKAADDSAWVTLNAYTYQVRGSGTFNTAGGSSMNLGVDGNALFKNAAGLDFTMLQFGGTTSSFPAWKRSSTTLQARLADDSGSASIRGFALTVDSGTNMITSSTAFNNGAAAATGTLTNAPAAGNPTKWIPINDSGTTRYIPAW